MRKDLAEIVCCPEDKARLEVKATELDEHEDIIAGTMTCTQCNFVYPIEGGIPNLLPQAYHAGNVSSKPAAKADSKPDSKAE